MNALASSDMFQNLLSMIQGLGNNGSQPQRMPQVNRLSAQVPSNRGSSSWKQELDKALGQLYTKATKRLIQYEAHEVISPDDKMKSYQSVANITITVGGVDQQMQFAGELAGSKLKAEQEAAKAAFKEIFP